MSAFEHKECLLFLCAYDMFLNNAYSCPFTMCIPFLAGWLALLSISLDGRLFLRLTQSTANTWPCSQVVSVPGIPQH